MGWDGWDGWDGMDGWMDGWMERGKRRLTRRQGKIEELERNRKKALIHYTNDKRCRLDYGVSLRRDSDTRQVEDKING